MDALAIRGSTVAGAGNADDFVGWVTPHLAPMHRYAARLVGPHDADDVVQEALVRAWRKRSSYDERRGTPLPWLLAIVGDRARRHRSRTRPALTLVDDDRSTELRTADVDLEAALGRLSRRQREAVELYYFVDLDVATVAAVMGCAPGTVRATLHQARAALHDLLGDDDD